MNRAQRRQIEQEVIPHDVRVLIAGISEYGNITQSVLKALYLSDQELEVRLIKKQAMQQLLDDLKMGKVLPERLN